MRACNLPAFGRGSAIGFVCGLVLDLWVAPMGRVIAVGPNSHPAPLLELIVTPFVFAFIIGLLMVADSKKKQ